MSRRRSVILDVDGQPVRLCDVQGELSAEAQAAIAEIVRAAKAMHERECRRTLADDVADGLHDQPHP